MYRPVILDLAVPPISGTPLARAAAMAAICALLLAAEAIVLAGRSPDDRAASGRAVARAWQGAGWSCIIALCAGYVYLHLTLDANAARYAQVYTFGSGVFTVLGWGLAVFTVGTLIGETAVLLAAQRRTPAYDEAAPGAAGAGSVGSEQDALPGGRQRLRHLLRPWIAMLAAATALDVVIEAGSLITRGPQATEPGSGVPLAVGVGFAMLVTVLGALLLGAKTWQTAVRNPGRGRVLLMGSILAMGLGAALNLWVLVTH